MLFFVCKYKLIYMQNAKKTYLTGLSEMRSHAAKVCGCLGKRLWKPTEPVQTICQYKLFASHLAVLYKTSCKGKTPAQEWKIPVVTLCQNISLCLWWVWNRKDGAWHVYPGFKWSWKCAHFCNMLLHVLSLPWILQSQTLAWNQWNLLEECCRV